jgi:hypothetical protein
MPSHAVGSLWAGRNGRRPLTLDGWTLAVLEQAASRFRRVCAKPGGWPDRLIVLPTAANNVARDRITFLAARHRLPAIYPLRFYSARGGLMSYGFDTTDLSRRGASYVDRILKGENPADLAVQGGCIFSSRFLPNECPPLAGVWYSSPHGPGDAQRELTTGGGAGRAG